MMALEMMENDMTISSDVYKEIKDWKVGQEYEVTVKAKLVKSWLCEDGKTTKNKFVILKVKS